MPETGSLFGKRHGRSSSVLIRLAGLALLFAAELTLLTVWYDFGDLPANEGWWSNWLVRFPLAVRLGLIAGGAMLAVGVARMWPELRVHYDRLCRVPHWHVLVAGHLVAVALFAFGIGFILQGGMGTSGHPKLVLALLGAAGAASLALGCLALFPIQLWIKLIARGWIALAVGGIAAVVIWRSKSYLKDFWRPLADATFWLSEKLLSLANYETISDPETFDLGTDDFQVNIARACSGYEGVGLISAFVVGYLWLFRRRLRFPRAWLLVPLGALAIWLANGARIAILIGIGSSWSSDVALGGFHSQAGWIAFNAIALGLVAIAGRSRFFSVVAHSHTVHRGANLTAAYLTPFLAIVATSMVTAAFTDDFNWLYPLRVVAAGAALWWFCRSYTDVRATVAWEPVGCGLATFGLWIWLAPEGDGARGWPAPLAEASPLLAGTWLVFRVLGYVVTVPIAEELAFRSYLTRRLISADFAQVPVGRFTWLSFLGSAALFGAMHGSAWLPATLAGLLFALVLYRRGETADAITAHATTNLLLAVYALGTGDWSAWS